MLSEVIVERLEVVQEAGISVDAPREDSLGSS
jgi:hypothetical protein